MKQKQENYHIPDELLPEFDIIQTAIKLGDTEEPRKLLDKLLVHTPNHPRLLNSLAGCYLIEEIFDVAEKIYLQIIEIAPDFDLPYGNLSLIYQKTGEIDKAIKFADTLLEKGSRSAAAWDFVGLLHFKKGNHEIALEYFLAAISLEKII